MMKIATISTYGVAGISRSMVDMMIEQAKARIDFDMDPAGF